MNVNPVGNAKKQVVEKEERGRNIVIFGVPEDGYQTLESQVERVLNYVGQKPRIVEYCRLVREQDGAVCPVKVTFSSSGIVTEVLRNSKMLKYVEGCRKISICPNRTFEQRRTQKVLIIQLRESRSKNPNAR